MALDSFANLKQSIELWSHRDDLSDVIDVIDDMVALAENKIDKHLRLRSNETRSTATLSTRFLALPDKFLQMRRMTLISGSNNYELQQLAPEAMSIKSVSGQPEQFTVTSQLEFDRVPSGSYTVEMSYYKKLAPLTTSNTSNNVLVDYPDLYLYGALAEVHRWARDESLADYYDSLFDKNIMRANKQEMKGRRGPAPRMASQGNTP